MIGGVALHLHGTTAQLHAYCSHPPVSSFLPTLPLSPCAFLAQEGIPVAVQIEQFVERVVSPAGIIALALSGAVAVALIATRRIVPALIVAVLIVSCFQANHRIDSNVLIGPLQSFRYFSKPLAFVLLLGAIFFSFGTDRGLRRSSTGAGTIALLLFQCYYLIQLTVFAGDGLLKGAFGIITAALTWWVFAVHIGRSMQDLSGARRALRGFAYVGMAFVAVNLFQMVVSLGGALEAGRLAGIAGNAQMMGCMCTMLLIMNIYVAFDVETPPTLRTACMGTSGLLLVLMLATGSRTAMLATAVAGVIMFRNRIGRIAVFAMLGVAAIVLVSLVFSDVTAIAAERITYGEDTRTAGWLRDLENFYDSPIFGQFPFLKQGEVASGIESVFIRTLSSMGIVGFLVLSPVLLSVAASCVGALQLMRASAAHTDLCSLYLGSCAALLVFNTFDGYAFGLVTFPVITIYIVLTLGAFLDEERERLGTGELAEFGLAGA
jgi:hypothetical protein